MKAVNNITSAQYLHVGIAIAIFSMCDFEVTPVNDNDMESKSDPTLSTSEL